jgi:hypothetical protein
MEKMNSINPRVVSEKWRSELSNKEKFVIEGVSYSLMIKYGYLPEKYKKDNFLYRSLLLVLIAIPSQFETKVLLKNLRFSNYISFIKKSFQESSQHETLKDYTRNGTYLYKWSYIYLRLWNTPLYKKFVIEVQNTRKNNVFKYLIVRVFYIASLNVRYFYSIIFFPIVIIKRINLMYNSLIKRIKLGDNIPVLLEKKQYKKL